MLALTAVLPLPNRSKAPPARRLKSFQFGTFAISAIETAGDQNDAGAEFAGMPALKWSHRPPALIVTRLIFHWSCTYAPPSIGICCLFDAVPFTTVTDTGSPLRTVRTAMSP